MCNGIKCSIREVNFNWPFVCTISDNILELLVHIDVTKCSGPSEVVVSHAAGCKQWEV